MKRKLFTFLMAFLAIAGNAVWATVTNPTNATEDNPFDLASESVKITDDGTYWIKSSSQTSNGIEVVNSAKPTIYLVNVDINVAGSAIEIKRYAEPTFVLIGENKITSAGNIINHTQNKAAIDIADESSLIISEKSTGILDINMTSTRTGEQVAIGAGGTGAPYGDRGTAEDCGSLIINGGTIETNGYVGYFYSHAIKLEKVDGNGGNGILITKKIYYHSDNATKDNCQLESGILFEDNTIGTVYGQPTLNSPIPEGYQVNMENATVTVGKGQSYTEEQFQNLEKGTLKAYELSYTAQTPEGISITDPATLPEKQYVGYNTPLVDITVTVPVNTYNFWGWLLDKQFYEATPSTAPDKLEPFAVSGVWVVDIYSVEKRNAGDEIFINLIYPTDAASLFTAALKEGEALPDDLKLEGTTVSGKLNKTGTTNCIVSLNSDNSKTETSVLKFSVENESSEEPTDIATAGYKLNIAELIYNGQEQEVPVTVEDEQGNKLTAGTDYTVTPANVKNVQDEGYSISVKGIGKYSGELTGTLTVKPAPLRASVDPITVDLNGEQPDFKNAKITYEEDAKPFGDDDVTINLGDLLIDTSISGERECTFKSASLDGKDKGNYVLEGSVTVKIIVGDDEDMTDINDDNIKVFVKLDEGMKFEYDGDVQEQDPTHLIVVMEEGNPVPYKEGVDFEVTLNRGEDENVLFREAGEYDVVVTPIGDKLKGDPIILENALKIWPKPVTVVAQDINYTIGQEEEVNMEGVLAIEEGGICTTDESLTIVITTSSLLTQEFLEGWCTVPGTYVYTYKGVEVEGLGENYEVTNSGDVKGNIIVSKQITEDDPLTPGSDNSENADITLDSDWSWNGSHFFREYDGKEHAIESIRVKTNEGWTTLSAEDGDFTVDYKSQTVKNVGVYEIEISLEKYYEGKSDLRLFISPRKVEVDLNLPKSIVEGQELYWNPDFATFEGLVAGEEDYGKIDGKLEVAEETENGLSVKVQGLKLVDNEPFLAKNYEAVYMHNGTTLTLDENGNGDIPGNIDIIEQAPAEDVKPNESGWTSEDGKVFTRVYDGKSHALESIVVGNTTMTDGFTIDYNGADAKVKDAGRYEATIRFAYGQYGPTPITLVIEERPMHVWFNLPASVEEAGVQLPAANYVAYEAEAEGRGLIGAEGTPAVASGVLSISLPIDGKCSVKLMNFALGANTEGFLPSNYQIQVWDATQGKWIDYDGGEVAIVDPNDPDNGGEEGDNPNGEGGSGITVDDPDDPNTDPDNPGTDPDDPSTDPDDPNKPGEPSDPNRPGQGGGSTNNAYKHYNLIIDEVCDGIELSASRNVIREGNQVSIYMEIAEGCDTTGMKLEYKRSLFGSWEDLKPHEGVQPGEYIIENIYTDIYVRATGAKMNGSATGIEDVENTQIQVYAQDGNIRIFTPELVEVQIVNMAGVVVKNAEQTGWQSYAVDRGIYIVRVGEQVFKLKL